MFGLPGSFPSPLSAETCNTIHDVGYQVVFASVEHRKLANVFVLSLLGLLDEARGQERLLA
jgi:hypothetical protein